MSVSPDTEIKMIVGDEEFITWQRYDIESDMLQPADAFSLSAPNSAGQMAGKVKIGDLVKILVDNTVQMIGYVDDVNYTADDGGAYVEITGRDLMGPLIDCSSDTGSFKNQSLKTLAEKLAAGWIDEWIASDEMIGKKITYYKQNAVWGDPSQGLVYQSDPTIFNTLTYHTQLKIEPGETVLDVLQRFAQKDNLLVWMFPDGTGVIGKPNYNQEPLYNLYFYKRTNPRRNLNNVIRQNVRESWRERYSSITVHGNSGNTSANSGKSSISKCTAFDSDITVDRPLILTDGDIRSYKQAKDKAELEVARRKFDGEVLEYTVKGHYGVGSKGSRLWRIDTICDVEDEYAAKHGRYYITRRKFTGDENGRFTEIEMHPAGVWLT